MKRDDMSKAASPSSPEGGRRPTGGDEGEARAKKFFAKHKTQAVLRILRGEPMEIVSRDIGTTAAVLSSWRDSFLASGTQGFAKKPLHRKLKQRGSTLKSANSLWKTNYYAKKSLGWNKTALLL